MALSRTVILSAAVLLLLVTSTLAKDNVPSTPTDANTNSDSGSSVDHVPGTKTNAGGGTPAPAHASKDHVPGTASNAGDNKDSGTSVDHVPGTKGNAGGGTNSAMTQQAPVLMAKLMAAAGVFGLMLF